MITAVITRNYVSVAGQEQCDMTTSLHHRAEVVGSFLRPATIKQARQQFDAGGIDATALCRIDDTAIRFGDLFSLLGTRCIFMRLVCIKR